ncbi:hypothetical protein [Mycolicibacterium arseniciresistens]|uniref:Uncharacterized protein n=1 Tax=Mycolicibacterium arseniciresistens TaxID=3062257 RepID=A0ABT8UMJ7_9MYCO|nr:hypothetical protein [Mycolicibacterium arseniciresistens]MDO3639033.1 hypothetical protein [Mycolicibacterium arseniciresistens]
MTELSTAPAATMPSVVPAAQEPTTQVLITEQQVLFSTAAAAAPAVPGRAHRLAQWLHAVFETPQRTNPPARLDFLERSAMSREMGRL